MTVIGGNLEKKEIGLQIGVEGTHKNTLINEDGHLSLKIIDIDGSGNPIYAEEGEWISNVINLEDKFQSFEKVFANETHNGVSTTAILTRVSDNSMDWSEWIAVAEDGTIQSETKQYIQVKIKLFAGFVTDIFLVSDFDNAEHINLFTPNNFIETSNGLRLKRDYKFDMNLDTNWSEEGSLHRKKITRDEWLRIDKMNVLRK